MAWTHRIGARTGLAAGIAVALAALLLAAAAPGAAFHLYRGPGGGCTPADGALGDAGAAPAATVLALHTTFHTGEGAPPLAPVTVIAPGQAVQWTWNSAHCHSVWSGTGVRPTAQFYSGFHYPAAPPESPQALPGLVDYPVPDLTPTLSYTRVFDEPGVYPYFCEHHWYVGMMGVVVVQ